MSKPHHAKLVSCEQNPANPKEWVAIDSTGRKFIEATKDKAIGWLNLYNHIKAKPSEEPKS